MEKGHTMLIVDDAWENRMILNEIFKDEFYIVEANNGKEALDIILKEKNNISVLLLDIVMPVMNGHEVLKIMNEDSELSDIPVIVISASDIADNELLSLNLGAWDYITKPFDIKVISQRVQNVISKNELKRTKIENIRLEEYNRNLEIQRHRAEHDSITGLYNMQTFCIKVKEALIGSKPGEYIVMRYDIAQFKVVNDLFGFETGDRLLKYIADTTVNILPKNSICCRIEADHFCTFLPYEYNKIEQLIKELCKRADEFDIDFGILPSFGIYIVDDFTISVNLMCDRALIALKTIKNNYVDRYTFYDKKFRDKIVEEQKIVNEMNNALSDEQFKLYFQPQYNPVDETIVGAEVLVRWLHPEKGTISPGIFIPIFEKNRFVTELDEYVWTQSCKWLRKHIDTFGEKNTPAISVNISRVDIITLNLFDILSGLVVKYNIPLNLFRLEITESAYIENPKYVIDVVKKLKEYGFIIEMDDFGSGYSSLNTLKELPVDILKLDMRFLSGEDSGGRGESILNSVVRMAKWLDMPVIAEGVETKEHADFLKSIGCYQIQGFYYSKPLPMDEFERLLKGNALISTSHGRTKKALDNLWDVNTVENIIFNSYSGAAGFFEYHNKQIEVIRLNDKYFEQLKIERDSTDIYKLNLREIIHPDDEYKIDLVVERAATEKKEIEEIIRWKRVSKGGEYLWLKMRVQIVYENEGRYLFYLTVEDVTDKIVELRSLKWQNERYRIVMDLMNTISFDYDTERDILTYSIYQVGETVKEQVICNYLNYLPNSKVIHAKSEKTFRKMLTEKIEKKGTIQCYFDFDGNGHVLKNVNYATVADEHGSVYRVVARVDDIKNKETIL